MATRFTDLAGKALAKRAQQLHAKAASVVDPDTGKHGTVFLRKTGDGHWSIFTRGSPAYMRAVRERLGLDAGEVRDMDEPARPERQVYLAHATEDKAVAEQLARGLTARGIEVWYDSWEIRAGDSLRQKMDQGLEDCTHFVVLLTPTSIKKRWVNQEIDAGLMHAVEGRAHFAGLRHNLPLDALTPLLRTRLTPEYVPGDEGLDALAAEGIPMGVVSNKSGTYLRLETAHLGWDRYFHRILGSQDAPKDKPAADPIHMALEGTGVAAGPSVWFVGDSVVDLAAAHAARCVPVLIHPDDPPPEDFSDCPPAAHLFDCYGLLGELRG